MEVWKDIKGYEGLYQVSNLGNVRSLNWRGTKKSKLLWLKPHNQGYLQVELYKQGKRKMFTVHRLVATAFIPTDNANKVVNHKDENKQNNSVENLEWCSFTENVKYSVPHKRKRGLSKMSYPIQQLTINNEVVKCWESAVQIKNLLGYSDWSIRQCCRGKRKTAYGYKWQFAI